MMDEINVIILKISAEQILLLKIKWLGPNMTVLYVQLQSLHSCS